MKGDIQFLSDALLLERTFKIIDAARYDNDDVITKQASLMDIVTQMGEGAKKAIMGETGGSTSTGVAHIGLTVLQFLTTGALFRIHPMLGLLSVAANYIFHINVETIFNSMVSHLAPTLQANQKVTPQQVDEAAQKALASSGAPTPTPAPEEKTASHDFFYGLRELDERGEIYKLAASSSNPFMSILSNLGGAKGMSFVVGLLGFLLKNCLIGAGLLAAGGAVAGLVGAVSGSGNQAATPAATAPSDAGKPPAAPPAQGMPAPTGAGNIVYRKTPTDHWVEPLRGRTPYEMVADWAIESYPMFEDYEDKYLSSNSSDPSFRATVQWIAQDWAQGENAIIMPASVSKRDDIVNMFAPNVYRKIKGTT